MRTGIYTAIYGGYEPPRPLPAGLAVDEAVLYTDDWRVAEISAGYGWTPKIVRHGIATLHGDPRVTAPMLAHKWWKLHPHLALPDCDVSMWIDGSMTINTPDYTRLCLGALGDDDWSMMRHPWRDCAIAEGHYSATLEWRYDREALTRQAGFYGQFHPRSWGLVATGANVRRHTEPVRMLCDAWWTECLTWSHQDQVSLPVLLRLAGLQPPARPMGLLPLRWNMNLPWWQWWDLHEHGME